jgi:CRP-like cAMP-binding protein
MDILFNAINLRVNLPLADYAEYLSFTKIHSYKKGEHIIQAGEILKFNVFIAKGCVRTYFNSDDGKERTTRFAEEGQWTGDLESLRKQKPTQQNLQVLEDTDIVTLSRENWEYVYKKFAWMVELHAAKQQKEAMYLTEHVGTLLNDSPEENYARLLRERPTLVQRVPQYYLASYLGISPETLSRVRKKKSIF